MDVFKFDLSPQPIGDDMILPLWVRSRGGSPSNNKSNYFCLWERGSTLSPWVVSVYLSACCG